ncbi:MAG TPA: winged helix DNA-binding domain-containing protein [Gaiellaceae bacterium]|nr:winged helix DNA-binding domain-containing protein [Gaiellaceae bacterium]
MAERTLTTRDLNRALLARQLLLERVRLPIPRVLERMGTLQAQYAPSMYIGLWSRIDGFERAHLDRALEQRKVVQGTLMRSTIHLVSRADYWPLAVAIRESRHEWWLRVHKPRPDPRKLAAAAARLRKQLAGDSLSRSEIDRVVRGGPVWVNGVGLWLDLVRVPPSGTWERRRADIYAAAEDWIGPEDIAVGEALEHLVRRYLGGFGPATKREIASWAGVPPSTLDPALERMTLRRFRAEDGDELLDLPRAPLPAPDTPAPVRFLPVWDATLLVHARRTGILSEEHRTRVFNTKTPHSFPTFLVDGTVAGSWRYESGKIDITPFGHLSRAVARELQAESERLLRLFA